MDFETIMKFVVVTMAVVGIPIGAYAAIVATRAIWVKGEPGTLGAEDAEALRHRVEALESQMARLAEIEDRLDFTERLLAEPGHPGALRKEN